MNYSDLTTNIADICEKTFTAAQLAMFVQQAEQNIFNAAQLPVLRTNTSGALTINNRYYSLPANTLYLYSIAVVDANGDYQYLIEKDADFILEAYPDPTDTGTPKYYGMFDEATLIVGPTPSSGFTVSVTYGTYPTSIVSAGTTWLGDNFDTALLNGALVEAIRFMKGPEDMVKLYEQRYVQALALLKNLSDGKNRTDVYRSGEPRAKVR